MQVNQVQVEEVQGIIDDLEGVVTERIKAETLLEKEMEILENLNCSSTEEASKTLKQLDAKLNRREADVKEEFADFMEDYGSLF